MTIKIRFHGDKAIIRWKHPGEAAFLKQQMTMFRDSMNKNMPISVKDERGREVPKLLQPRAPLMQQGPAPVASGQTAVVVGGKQIPSVVNSGSEVRIEGQPESGTPISPVTVVMTPQPVVEAQKPAEGEQPSQN